MVVIGFSFIPAGFILFLVQERALKAKHLQFVSGLNPLVYWISNIIWDLVSHPWRRIWRFCCESQKTTRFVLGSFQVTYLIPAGCCLVVIYAFGVDGFTVGENFQAVVCLLLLFGYIRKPDIYEMLHPFNDGL